MMKVILLFRKHERDGRHAHRFGLSALAALVIFALPASAEAHPLRLLVFGDSLTSGFLLPEGSGFSEVLARSLQANGHDDVIMLKGSVPGDTTSNAVQRLPSAIQTGADLAIVELGGNDMLEGTDPRVVYANLDWIIGHFKAEGARVILAGMSAVPKFGPTYKSAFDSIYPSLAAKYKIPLYPFFLRGVFGDPRLMLNDGKHPNELGVRKIVAGILPLVARNLEQERRRYTMEQSSP
jgi:acyl-CoA thioesterase-1